MENRLVKVECKIDNILVDQAEIKTKVTSINDILSTLIDVRAETLHLIKQQIQDQKEHDEMFIRLRAVENGQIATSKDITLSVEIVRPIEASVKKLENNQRWGVITILGGIFSTTVFYLVKAISGD